MDSTLPARGKTYTPLRLARAVPVCPKCGKLISAKKFKRHLERCGSTHKHHTAPLSSGDNFLERV